MKEVIVNTDENYDEQIGKENIGTILAQEGDHRICSVKIVRKATIEEYFECVKSYGLLHKIKPSITSKFFYKVEILD